MSATEAAIWIDWVLRRHPEGVRHDGDPCPLCRVDESGRASCEDFQLAYALGRSSARELAEVGQ